MEANYPNSNKKMTAQKILARGAEAKIFLRKGKIIKERIKKSYRLQILDEKIRKQRTKKESGLLEKLQEIIPVPKIIGVSGSEITMEKISGKKLSEHLDKIKNAEQVCIQIGKTMGKLHDADVIHGDLTTSNMILSSSGNKTKVYFIDFGLSFHSNRVEDKAVDLHLIKQALEARHYEHFKVYFANILRGYKKSKNSKQVLMQLEKVEKRGRYKAQY